MAKSESKMEINNEWDLIQYLKNANYDYTWRFLDLATCMEATHKGWSKPLDTIIFSGSFILVSLQ